MSKPHPLLTERPTVRPLERFWPYAELAEEPTTEELSALDPDLHAALFGATPRPFSVTLSFPVFEGEDYDRALELARASTDFRTVGHGPEARHRVRYYPSEARALRSLFEIVSRCEGCEVLIDDRPLPYARELWLPLFWYLIAP